MKVAAILSVIRKKQKSYKRSTPQHVAENILNREFTAEKPNEKWVADVTELKYGSSKKAFQRPNCKKFFSIHGINSNCIP
jgi:transposase InsO family protein